MIDNVDAVDGCGARMVRCGRTRRTSRRMMSWCRRNPFLYPSTPALPARGGRLYFDLVRCSNPYLRCGMPECYSVLPSSLRRPGIGKHATVICVTKLLRLICCVVETECATVHTHEGADTGKRTCTQVLFGMRLATAHMCAHTQGGRCVGIRKDITLPNAPTDG